jgi:thiamine biosynthesis protein ThiI
MKFVSLISSGIDSPVASYLSSKKADDMILIHADINPFTDEKEINKFLRIAIHLKKISHCKIKLYLISHGNSLALFKKQCNNRLTCIFCKRMILRYAERIAENEKAHAIITGDCLGQVASQTLKNIQVIDIVVNIPILRPLIGFDKEDIIRVAKKIGTYKLSILPSQLCTAVPNKPVTQAKIEKILEEEKKINITTLLNQAIEDSEVINI